MKGVVFLMIIGGIFAQEPPFQHKGPTVGPPMTRESESTGDISILPVPHSPEDTFGGPPTRDVPQQKFNFPDEVGTQQYPSQTQQYPSQKPQYPQQQQYPSQTPQYPQQQNIQSNIGCTKDHDPLCGSDGKTYNNICEFSQAQRNTQGLTVARRGQC